MSIVQRCMIAALAVLAAPTVLFLGWLVAKFGPVAAAKMVWVLLTGRT